VVQRAQGAARNDDDGKAKRACPFAHFVAGRERNAPPAHAFHGQMGKARAHGSDRLVQGGKVDGAILGLRGEEGRGGLAEMDGVDFIQRQDVARGGLQAFGVLAIAGGDGFERRGVIPQRLPGPHEPAREPGLADARVCSGDEEGGHEENWRLSEKSARVTPKGIFCRRQRVERGA